MPVTTGIFHKILLSFFIGFNSLNYIPLGKRKPHTAKHSADCSDAAKELLYKLAYLAYLAYKNKLKKEQENSNTHTDE